ncbi:MAG: formate C-acetyltransferase/glycerol dehydratase family glycyl radical enzyme [Firmicutes bacterium]|nr:formate C-acetyltransferase/glycerol dehydratase family glycyl radical enzyme [Bacillota bacterium]
MAITNTMLEYGVEPFDQDWGTGKSGMGDGNFSPYPRINKLRKIFLDTPHTIDEKRAVIWTETLKNNVEKPYIVRCAEAFREVLRRVPLYINENLILGDMAAPPRSAPVFPEFSYDWFVEEFDSAPFNERDGDRFEYTKETEEILKSLHPYWKGRTVHDLAKSLMTDEELKGEATYGKALFFPGNYFFGGVGHCSPRFELLFEKGWKGIREKIEKAQAALDLSTPEGVQKNNFYRAELIAVEAISIYIQRYVDEARKLASETKDEQRKKELLNCAKVCERIVEDPPTDFWEALQMAWFITVAILIESNGHSIAYGRFDQYMYPYYKKAIAEGSYTKDFMQELIECFWIKVCELTKIRDAGSTQAFGGVEIGGPSLTLGGVTPGGEDAVNELSFMGIDALAHLRLQAPWVTTRHHPNQPYEWWVKCTKVAKMGFGLPSFFNDEVIIPSMVNRGRAIEDARDYNALGCVEPDAGGREYGWHDMCFFNMNKVFELALNNGRCLNCNDTCPRYEFCAGAGKQLGIPTGSLADFKTFEEVKEAYDKQMKHWVDCLVGFCNSCDIAHQTRKPLPYLSLLIEDCIEKGIDVTAGGARYNFIGPQGLAAANVGDGLAAIKKLIFEEKKITGAEMLDALKKDWEGYEAMHALVNSSKVPHYGNDDLYADELARFAALSYCKHLEKRPTAHGGIFQPGLYPVSGNIPAGANNWATPDGRKAGEPTADGVSPVHTSRGSHDISGPTAVVKSVSTLDHCIASNGTLLNMKFTPSTLAGEVGDENFINMMQVYFQRKGMHNQINVISREVLEDAVKNPEQYKGLIVRVAGYSAFFTELDPSLQQDLIERTELEF